MDSQETFWLNIWRLVGMCVILLCAIIASCDSYQVSLVASSPDPVATRCAISANANAPACLVVATRR